MTLLLEVILPLLVIFIMIVVGMDLRFADFLRIRQYPVLVPCIVVGQWIVLMIVAGLVGRLLALPYAVAGGVLLVAAAPVATLANYYTQVARGNLALSVTVTAVSNVLAAIATPFIAKAGFALFLGEAAAFDLPVISVARQTVLGLLLPLLIGMALRHRAAVWTVRWRSRFQALALVLVAAVLAFVVVDQFAMIREHLKTYFGTAVLFTLVTLVIGFVVARLVAPAGVDRRAMLWSFPARNAAVATYIGAAVIGQVSIASFVAVLFATQVALLVPLALWMGQRAANYRQQNSAPNSA